MSKQNDTYYFLEGGGEMGELIRATDWSKTTLGDPAGWPSSLRTMVAVMLGNPFGMYIAWGNEFTQLYNDGYRPILGSTKHPQALGNSTKETFSEIWHIIGTMFDGVMKGEAVGFPDFMLPLNRNGFVEECYFDFSYSPIRTESGEVGGVLVTVIETTEKKRATDALKESNARFLNNITQAPVAMCIFRGGDFIVEIANEQMLAIWGKTAAQVMNKPIFEGLPEAKDQGLETLLEQVYTTGIKFTATERRVDLPRNGQIETVYINFVYEAIKEPDGKISGIMAIAIEVTDQVVARSKTEQSEQKVRAVVENAPFPIAVYAGEDMRVELANESIIKIWGKGNDVIGKTFTEILPELENQLVFDQIRNVYNTGQSFHTKNTPLELVVDGVPGTYYFNYSFTPLLDLSGKIYGVMNTGVDLTDLNVAKAKLEESEDDLRNMVLQSPIGICVIDAATLVSEIVNDSFVEVAGKRYEEIAGKHYWDTFAEAKPYYEAALDNVIKEGHPYYANEVAMMLIRHGKEEIIYVTFVYAPLKNAEGKVKKVAVWVLDNTQQVTARLKIEEADKRFRNTVKQAPVGITILRGPQYMVEMANEAYLQLVDRKEQEFVGRPLFDSLPEVQEAVHSLLDNVLNTGTPYHGYEVPIPLYRQGQQDIYYFDFLYAPLKEDDGEINGIIVTVSEVTEKVETRKKIEQNEQRLSIVVEASELGTWELNLNTREVNYSERYLEIVSGYKDGRVLTHEQLVRHIHTGDLATREKAFNEALNTGSLHYEARMIWHDNSIHWMEGRGKVFYDEKNQPEKMIGTIRDITYEKNHQQELSDSELKFRNFSNTLEKQVLERTRELGQKNIDLENMNRELQSFAYISSHDLQEPLRKIQTFSSQILEKEFDNLSDKGKDKFRRMQNSAQRMQILINDLLTYSRTNTQERKFEKTALNRIIEEVKEDLAEELQQKHATLESDADCTISIIPFQFRQLLYNLVSNSLKFSDKDRVLQITIHSEIANGDRFTYEQLGKDTAYCHIIVSDNGIGFEQQYSERIFDVFQRLHGKEQYNGTGIGLAIVKKIVDNHNGFITATGEPGKGARFDIYIPAT